MSQANKWKEELELLQSIIRKTGLRETTKWGGPVYTYNDKNILSCAGFKHHFVLVFFNGVFLKDKYKVLANAQEGKTKAMRHWRFTSMEEIDPGKVLEYVNEAIKNAQEGKEHKPEKSEKPLEIPEILAAALRKDAKLQAAFAKLAPYQQKLYAEHIATAKQEATKISRIEKIRPMIMQGIGLHDKYKS